MKLNFLNLIALTSFSTGILTASLATDTQIITKLQQYLRIKTVQPTPDYKSSTEFLLNYGKELGLVGKVYDICKPGTPFVIFTINGTTNSPSILLNSHTDVVAVTVDKWDYDPFEAKIVKDTSNRDVVVARGAQDVKNLGVAFMEAIRNLLNEGFKTKRTIHIMFTPNEEIGGKDGMECFVKTKEFKDLNVGFAWDEGLSSGSNSIHAIYSEKFPWQFNAIADGDAGHASRFIKNLATTKLYNFHTKVMNFRRTQERQVLSGKKKDGEVTSINLTILKGGQALNVVPDQITFSYDCRVSPLTDLNKFTNQLDGWAKSSNVTLSLLLKGQPFATKFDDSQWYYKPFLESVKLFKDMSVQKTILPGSSDSRFLRALNIPVIGFSPFRNITSKAHNHNEYMDVNYFLEGIKVSTEVIKKLANTA